jgi:hypothetical protein
MSRIRPLPAPCAPQVPAALPLTEALGQSAALADLRRRLQESAQRLEAVRPCLPATLRPHVQAGPVDAEGWTLLAANASVAAKLKQLKPRLEAASGGTSLPILPLRIKVVPRSSG